jgi:hypothetical protein
MTVRKGLAEVKQLITTKGVEAILSPPCSDGPPIISTISSSNGDYWVIHNQTRIKYI